MMDFKLDLGAMTQSLVNGIAGGVNGIAGGTDKVLDNGLLNPVGALIDGIGSAIGLPQPLTDVAKVAAGAVTGNPILMANGAAGLLAEVTANPPSVTEFFDGEIRGGIAGGKGYFEAEARFGPAHAQRDPLANLTGPGLYASDGARALGDILCGRHREPTGPVRGGGPYNPDSPLDPNITQYRDAVAVLEANFATFDTAAGRNDGVFTRADLAVIANNPNASDKLRDAAQFLLDNPEYYNRLELAANAGGKDGIIGWHDLKAEMGRVDREIAKYGVPPPEGRGRHGDDERVDGPSRRPPSGRSELSEILDDPNMSIEQKIMLILEKILDQTDEELLQVTKELDQSRASGAKGDTKAESAQEKLQLRLQQLMEKRKKMFDMMSNVSMKFNEMAKTALQNMARA